MQKKVRTKVRIDSEVYESTFKKLNEQRIDNSAYKKEICDFDLSTYEFYECTFDEVTFTKKMIQSSFTDVIFKRCDFSNIDLEEASFRRVEFQHCRLTGAQFINATFKDVLVKDCQCSYSNWNGSKMQQVELDNTIFQDGSFSLVQQKDILVSNCDFSNCEFINTKLNGFDFSNSQIGGITVTTEDLKGAIVNSEQAVVCAKLLGMIIKD